MLVDDHNLVRRGFRRILEDEPDIIVAGEAGSGSEAIKLAEDLRPKVIVMDCAMPGMNGLEATRQILGKQPQALVLMLSMHPEETLVRQALEAGARGYVLKNAVDLELGSAIRRVVKGETVLDSQLKRPVVLKGKRHAGLTPRELEVLQMIVEGKSNKEIATVLGLSGNTGNTGGIFGSDRPDVLRNPELAHRTPQRWFDTSAFVVAPRYQFGSAGRNILEGPALVTFDLALSRRFMVRERTSVSLDAEAFNLLNRTNFDLPERVADDPTTFGRIFSAKASRQIQLALRLVF